MLIAIQELLVKSQETFKRLWITRNIKKLRKVGDICAALHYEDFGELGSNKYIYKFNHSKILLVLLNTKPHERIRAAAGVSLTFVSHQLSAVIPKYTILSLRVVTFFLIFISVLL